MESQEKIHVPIFTGINKDIFLQEIYPQVRRNFSMLRFLWMSMCPQSPYLWLSVLLLFIFSPSANQPSWEGLIWGHVWKNGQLNISDREEQIRKWRSTYPLSHRWTFFTKTLCTSELPHTHAHRHAKSQTRSQPRWFIHRTLPFSEFVKRASERKHSDFFLCEVTIIKILCI